MGILTPSPANPLWANRDRFVLSEGMMHDES
ncbi:hypothetical protein [Vreelandella titanicae]